MEAQRQSSPKRLTFASRLYALALAFLLVLTGASAQAQNTTASREALIKAAMVYNFIRFIEWPGEVDNSRVVCTFEGSSLSAAMQSIAGKPIGSAEVVVRELADVENLAVCDVVVTTQSDSYVSGTGTNVLIDESILTVSDRPGFAARGGVIGFTERDARIGFEVNVDQAAARGLKFSSRLLRLAKIISSDEVVR